MMIITYNIYQEDNHTPSKKPTSREQPQPSGAQRAANSPGAYCQPYHTVNERAYYYKHYVCNISPQNLLRKSTYYILLAVLCIIHMYRSIVTAIIYNSGRAGPTDREGARKMLPKHNTSSLHSGSKREPRLVCLVVSSGN